jgi:hypothetical protein
MINTNVFFRLYWFSGMEHHGIGGRIVHDH